MQYREFMQLFDEQTIFDCLVNTDFQQSTISFEKIRL